MFLSQYVIPLKDVPHCYGAYLDFVFIILLRLEKDFCSLQSCLEGCESVSASATQYLTVDKTKLHAELMELKVNQKALLSYVQKFRTLVIIKFLFSSTFTLSYSP